MYRSLTRRRLSLASAVAALVAASASAASALSIELKDVAADRIERQRSAAAGALPLPNTPNVAILDDRLRKTRVAIEAPMLIRIFKSESELEIWKQRDGAFVLFATYPICHWSGSVGPKLRQGDKQAPEGFYTLTRQQIRHVGRWPKSLDLGFPNVFDQSMARTGSLILIHGGCSSVGCFAMTNPVMDEIHLLASASIEAGQEHIPVQVFPFRMTDKAMVAQVQAQSPWLDYWKNLKEGHDLFERTKRAPVVSVCDGRYGFQEGVAGSIGFGPLQACGSTLTAIREQNQWLRDVPQPVNSPLRTGDRQSSLRPSRVRCDMDRPSCRKHVALMSRSPSKRKAFVLAAARRVEARADRGG